MILEEYLKRIHYTAPLSTDLKTLAGLMKHHLLAIPFENLDIHNGTWIDLDFDKFYNKIITRRRGGFCYELNGSFYQLLLKIGFDVKMICAKVYLGEDKGYTSPSHMALEVKINEQSYLADVGFGDLICEPLEIRLSASHTDPCGKFRLVPFDEPYFLLEKLDESGAAYIPKYAFTLVEYRLSDFTNSCYYNQKSPDSAFTKNKICSILTPSGRKTITGTKFIISEGGSKTSFDIAGNDEFNTLLKNEFNIEIA